MSENIDDEFIRERSPTSRTIPERVAQFYYFLGLFCSTYSVLILISSISIVLISCYPILSLPLPGNRPQYFSTPSNHEINRTIHDKNDKLTSSSSDNFNYINYPKWVRESPPSLFIQQIVIKSAVVPWTPDSIMMDAFRGPLFQTFSLLKKIRSLEIQSSDPDNRGRNLSLVDFCLTVGGVQSRALKGKTILLPQNSCLLVSPANFWEENEVKFREDSDLLGTILNYESHQKGRSGLAELLLGMNIRETGIKRYPIRSRQRLISYAITIVLNKADPIFLERLKETLLSSSPPHHDKNENKNGTINGQNIDKNDVKKSAHLVHVYYPSQSSLFELFPLLCTYIAMFIYVYFSVKKFEMIKSKLGMALSALATAVASLCMSVGIVTHFGMSYEINAKAIFPYLFVIIGLENILVLTRSVVSTASHLDVKIRVAQGLSKEGWSITKNLFTEITILTIGFFTFIPMIQEFCILAIVGLLSDFFLQTFFFSTVLSIDIKRSETTQSQHFNVRERNFPSHTPIYPSPAQKKGSNGLKIGKKSGSSSNLPKSAVSVVAPSVSSPILVKLPKRVRLVYFWARTRFFQRTFIIFMVGWIAFIIYESGIAGQLKNYETQDVVINPKANNLTGHTRFNRYNSMNTFVINRTFVDRFPLPLSNNSSKFPSKSHHSSKLEFEMRNPELINTWRRLSPFHWQVLLGVYNMSLSGRYLTLLPPILVPLPVDFLSVIPNRHPAEVESAAKFNWEALSNALRPEQRNDWYEDDGNSGSLYGSSSSAKSSNYEYLSSFAPFSSWEDPYVPSSPFELTIAVLLAIPSLIFISYTMVVFYNLICSRNYAQWRSSWTKKKENSQEYYTEVVFEAVPLVLDGHLDEVECLSSDGNLIGSVCLGGVLKIWNASTGDNIITIDRKKYFTEDEGLIFPVEPHEDPFISEIEINSPSTSPNYNNSNRHLISTPPPPRESFVANNYNFYSQHRRTSSFPSQNFKNSPPTTSSYFSKNENRFKNGGSFKNCPAVWCIDSGENLVVLGTGSGRVEIWDPFSGQFKCMYEDEIGGGVMVVKLIGSRIVAARISGTLDFLEIEFSRTQNIENYETSTSPPLYHRWNSGELSGSSDYHRPFSNYLHSQLNDCKMRVNWLSTLKAHQQPITCLDSEGGKILTGSQDHSLKVFRLHDQMALFTLHGHYGPITCLFIDQVSRMMSGSGSQDGMLCVWDLLTGMCMYSTQAHDGPIRALTYSASYIISGGGDDKICVWERFQGHLLNTIQLNHSYCSSLVMLTHNLLISSKQGSLIVWDVRSGEVVRIVRLGHRDQIVSIKEVRSCGDAILCDYGTQLRLVRFPSIIHKND